MREIDYLRSLRDDGTALAAAAALGLEPPVPACPGWTVAELLEVFLWGRTGAGPLERSGDPAVAPRVRELAAAATR
jgi:hypothetical protein